MPNHVTNKIVFTCENAREIAEKITTDGCFDFEKLIASPICKYNGNLSSEDEKDFNCNWMSWNRENWGTKWNAYSGNWVIARNTVTMIFDTAWSVPYPVISAFANSFKVPFEHRYFDEGHNFWGIEKWSDNRGVFCRESKDYKNNNNYRELCIELEGYDPDDEE